MEYPHQQYVQYQQQQQAAPSQLRQHRVFQRGPQTQNDARLYEQQPMQPGAGDNEQPLEPSRDVAAIESLQALAQCSREEARFYLEEHNYDVHRAMAARTADVQWEQQHGGAPTQQQGSHPQQEPQRAEAAGPEDASLAQLHEARERLRRRYERETGDSSSTPGALELPLQQPSLTALPPTASTPLAPPVYYPTATVVPQYVAPHFAAQQPQPFSPTTATYLPAQSAMDPMQQQHYYAPQQQQAPYPLPTATTTTHTPMAYTPLQGQPQPTRYDGEDIDVQADQPAVLQGWDEARREEANIGAGASRENYLSLAGNTLGKWIWGGTHHNDKSSATSASSSSSSARTPLASSVSSPSFYQTPNVVPVAGEERPVMGRRHQSDESLEINELARNRRHTEGTARDEEATEEREESRGGLRHLFHSVRNRVRHHHGGSSSSSEPQQLQPAAEEEEIESRRSRHRRRSSLTSSSSLSKKEKKASLDEGWVLVDSTSSTGRRRSSVPVTQEPLTDEQYAARLSRQLAEEEERQRKRDEEFARRIQRQEEEEVRRRAREAEASSHEQRDRGRRRHASHGPIQVVVSRGPFGEMLVSEGQSPSALYIGDSRGRRRRTGGLIGLLEMMREMHEMSLAQESGYPIVLDPNASTTSTSSSRRQDMSYEQLLGLAERVGNVNRGVSHVAMDALPTRTYQDKEKKADEEDNKCTICLCEYEEGDTLRTLPCLHSYHKDCIDHWLTAHNTCPVCKTQINM